LYIKDDMGFSAVSPELGFATSWTERGFVFDLHLLFHGCLLRSSRGPLETSLECLVGADKDPCPLVVPVRGCVDLLELRQRACELAKRPLKPDLKGTNVHRFQAPGTASFAIGANTGEGLGDQGSCAAVFDVVGDQLAPQLFVGWQFPTSPQEHRSGA